MSLIQLFILYYINAKYILDSKNYVEAIFLFTPSRQVWLILDLPIFYCMCLGCVRGISGTDCPLGFLDQTDH